MNLADFFLPVMFGVWVIAFIWLRSLDPSFVEKEPEPWHFRKPLVASTWMETADPIPTGNPKDEVTFF